LPPVAFDITDEELLWAADAAEHASIRIETIQDIP
jgi:hypothetical protein